jgi:ABC-type transport system involved in multi-copper enzyme maturation permease subunit
MKAFWQIYAIAHTEFRFCLRRGGPVVVTALIGLLIGAGILINPIINLPDVITPQDNYTAQKWQQLAQIGITPTIERSLNRDLLADLTAGGSPQSWFPIYLGLLFLPVATAAAIPADRKFGTMELLRSLPIDGTRYLAGKMIGILATIILVSSFPFLLFLAILDGILLSYTGFGVPLELIGFFLKLSMFDGLPVLLCGAALGVIAGIAAHSRRAALLPGFAAGIMGMLIWLIALRPPKMSYNTYDLAAYHVFQGYRNIWQSSWTRITGDTSGTQFDLSLLGTQAPRVSLAQVTVMLIIAVVILAGLAVLARMWLRWKEDF